MRGGAGDLPSAKEESAVSADVMFLWRLIGGNQRAAWSVIVVVCAVL